MSFDPSAQNGVLWRVCNDNCRDELNSCPTESMLNMASLRGVARLNCAKFGDVATTGDGLRIKDIQDN